MYVAPEDGQKLPKHVAGAEETNKICCGSEIRLSFF